MQYGPGLPEDYGGPHAQGAAALPTRQVQQLKGHEGPVFAVRYSNNGSYCFSCGKVRGTVQTTRRACTHCHTSGVCCLPHRRCCA